MGESIDFIKDRATKTISAAKELQTQWTWQEKTITDYQALLTGIVGDKDATPPKIGQEEIASQAEQAMKLARGAWDTNLDNLHRRTVQGVSMAKNRHRANPANFAVLSDLSARGTSRAETLKEALAWESAWAKIDPTWNPLPANTLAAFKALRKLCEEDLKTAYADAFSDWRTKSECLAQLAAQLEDVNQAWYADATDVFSPQSPEGQMIRGTIPTTYNPPADKPKTPPAPTS
jgi:hypothetical protein